MKNLSTLKNFINFIKELSLYQIYQVLSDYTDSLKRFDVTRIDHPLSTYTTGGRRVHLKCV